MEVKIELEELPMFSKAKVESEASSDEDLIAKEFKKLKKITKRNKLSEC